MTNQNDPLVDALRASLAEHARQVPPGDLLAERIIQGAPRQAVSTRRGWRTWTLPLIAAGSVALVVGAVVGIQNYHPSAGKHIAPGTHNPTVTSPAPTAHATPTTTPPSTPSPSTSPTTATPVLHNVQILDLTFIGNDRGFALASADCINSSGRCTALLRTTNGTTWHGMSGPQFNVAGVNGCAAPCVTNIRFADDHTGYAFGPAALLMTTDGGQHWTRQPGGALFVETLDNNVIRVSATSPSGCPGPCGVHVETSDIGSTTWTPSNAVNKGDAASGVQFARGGHDAYLLFTGHVSGGAENATSTLYRSIDDGRTWNTVGEPCPQVAGEVDSTAVAAGGGDNVSVLCVTRQAPNRAFVATSSDAGAHFTARPGTVPAATARLLTGDPATVLVTAGDGLARSTDGGRSWSRVAGVSGAIGFVGFESPTVGRAAAAAGHTIWTTRDAGKSWAPVRIR